MWLIFLNILSTSAIYTSSRVQNGNHAKHTRKMQTQRKIPNHLQQTTRKRHGKIQTRSIRIRSRKDTHGLQNDIHVQRILQNSQSGHTPGKQLLRTHIRFKRRRGRVGQRLGTNRKRTRRNTLALQRLCKKMETNSMRRHVQKNLLQTTLKTIIYRYRCFRHRCFSSFAISSFDSILFQNLFDFLRIRID